MPRVLVCLDETPASDGTCANQAWEYVNTSPWPELSMADGFQLAGLILACWIPGLIARLIIRATQLETRNSN